MFYKSVTVTIPGSTNVIVAGATLNSAGNFDMLIAEYTGAGAMVWSQQEDGAGHGDDIVSSIAVNSTNGDIYMAGTYYENATDSNNAVVFKYNSAGVFAWKATFNGNGSANDAFTSLAVDNSTGDVYAAGAEWDGANRYDFLCVKYDVNGYQQWASHLDYANGDDGAYNIYWGRKGIVLAGGMQTGMASYDYAVVTIGTGNGVFSTPTTTSGSAPFGIDRLTSMVVDDSGYVYLTGGVLNVVTGYDFKTVKLDSALNIIWSNVYDAGMSQEDIASAIYLDNLKNVIVTGSSKYPTGKNYTTIKYNNNGISQWIKTFDGGGNDSATAIVVDPHDTDRIFVTGKSFNGSTYDYRTIRYDGAGNEIWDSGGIGFNSELNGNDIPTAIAIDTAGGIIVAGQNKIGSATFAYTTVKYIEHPTLFPQDTATATSSSFVYTENRGQLLNTSGDSVPQIRYYVMKGSPQVYFTDTAVSYVFAKLDTASSTSNDTLARVDMKFVNANADLKIRSMDVRSDYENFFLGHIPEGRSLVPNYNKLVSFNVWNNVDMMYASNPMGMKYYFICKVGGGGGSFANIDLKYEGADSVKVDGSGQLVIYTKLGTIVQPKSAAWQLDATGNYIPLGWQFSYDIVATNEVKFTNSSFGIYNPSLPVIIEIDWGQRSIQTTIRILSGVRFTVVAPMIFSMT
jgi:hypothetical protein